MEELIFSLEAVLPIVLLVALGYFLRRIGILNESIGRSINKLVFRAFLPVTLFLNVYKIDSFEGFEFGYIFFCVGMTLAFFLLSIPLVRGLIKEDERRGVTVQAIFRSNYAFVGIPLAGALAGDEGVIAATLLSAIIIPFYNILAVIVLTMHGKSEKGSIKKVCLSILKNPLIISIFAGLFVLLVRYLFSLADISFRISSVTPVYDVLKSISAISTPLALIVLGSQFEFSSLKGYKRPLLIGVGLRSFAVPLIALPLALLLGCFSGAHFASFIAVFVSPVATSTVPMTQELGGDEKLAGQLVVFTTILSGITVFLSALILKSIGVFV